MAQKNKASDPVSQAMLAIEDALNLGAEQDAAAETSPPSAETALPAPPPPQPPALKAPVAKAEETRRQPEPAELRLTPPDRHANDDRAAAGAIVQALQIKRSSRAPVALAVLTSLVWFALCGYYGYQRMPEAFTTPALLFRPESVLFLLAAVAPVMALIGFVALARRLQDLRQSAASIAHVADPSIH